MWIGVHPLLGVWNPHGIKQLHGSVERSAQRLTASGYEVVGSTPAELDRHIRREIEHWGRFVKEFPTRFD